MKNEKSVKTTSKKALHRFAAAASVLLAVCLVFMMPVSAETYECSGHEGWTELTGETTITTGMKYYLNNDLELSSSLTIPENAQVTLCLNGKTLKAAEGKTISIITVSKGAVLNLTDCNQTHGKITGTGTPVDDDGMGGGGGIFIKEGTVNMYGGNITDCKLNGMFGGGVTVYKGTFNMYGGSISNCKAFSGGGVYVVFGTFTMKGGEISNCKATQAIPFGDGGAVYSQNSKFEMNDGSSISECTAETSGGGISVIGSPTYGTDTTINGGTISECTAEKNGGGVYISSNSNTLTMTGGEIKDCTAESGGGIHTLADIEISGDAKISSTDGKTDVCLAHSDASVVIPENKEFSGTISGISVFETSVVKNSVEIKGTIKEGAYITFTISWRNADGTVLETDENVARGTTPTYNGDTPTKTADAQYTYTFSGWNPAISADSTNAVYTATYTTTVNKYTITWKNYDGSVLKTDSVEYGVTPSYSGQTPTKPNDAQNAYVFNGWTTEVIAVTGDAAYIANFTATDLPPAPSSSSSSSKGSDSGNYQYFPREVTADGIISFGSSKVVKGMELPAGSSGRVTLNTMPDFEMPENGFYAFEIDAPGYNLDAKINGGLSFQIKAADLEEEGWTAEDIVLFHGTVAEDGTITWEALPTSLVEVENGIAYYKAVINGCSPFYIGFVEDGSIVNEPVVEPSDEPTDVPQDVPGEDLPDIPGVQDEPEEPSTPAPILAVLAGLGAAVVLRRK